MPPVQDQNPAARITAYLQCTNLGGMEQVAYTLFERLQARGFRVKILTARVWGPGRSRVLGIDPEARDSNYRGKFGWRSFPAFRRHARTVGRPGERVWVIGNCASCLAAARLAGQKVMFSHHYHHFESRTSWLRWLGFYLAFGAGLEVITYPTEFTRNEALKIAPWLKGKARVVRYGFDLHYTTEEKRLADQRAARAELQMPQAGLLIGNGGWLIPRKRFDIFLRTAQRVARGRPDARFYICGGGPEEKNLRQLAGELGIADKVHFQGWVQNMAPYYRAWDVLLFNSDFDTSPCTPLEAASHGCLCVASLRYGGLAEFIQHGRTGFLLEEHDLEGLAGFIRQLAQEPDLALNLRRQAAELLAREFSHEKALAFYENYFRTGRV